MRLILCAKKLAAGIVLFAGSAAWADVAVGRVTYQHDVQPILERNCVGCHRPGQIAPMSFLTYESTRPWASQIKAMVAAKKMPPVVGSPHYVVLTRGEGLTQAEIDTLVAWVNDGAPEGATGPAKHSPPAKDRKK